MNHTSVIARASLYFAAIMCVNFGKEFADVGAAKLADFRFADWLVLFTPTMGNCLITLVAYFDRSFGNHMMNGGATPGPSGLTANDFKLLMDSWQSSQTTDKPATIEPPKTTP